MRVVHVTHLKARPFSGQTARSECRHPSLVGDLGQRIGLIHELAELIRTEERIDHRRERLRIDQVDRSKDFIVTHIHALPDGPRHTRKTHSELIGQLLANGAHPSVAQVVDIVHFCLGVDQFDQVFDDSNDVFLGQYLYIGFDLELEFLVQTVATDFAEIVSGLGEEELVNDAPCRLLIGRLGISQLAINVFHRFFFRVRRIFLKRVVDNGVVRMLCVLAVQKNGRNVRIQYLLDMVFFKQRVPIEDHFIPLDGYHFSCILVYKVFQPALQNTRCKFAAHHFLQSGFGNFDLLGQVKDLQYVLVSFVSDGTEQGGERELLLPVDVGVHHIVDVRGKFDPGTLERNDPCAV